MGRANRSSGIETPLTHLDRRDFVRTATTAAIGAGLGTNAVGGGAAAPDVLPTDRHMHRGHQDVIFLGIYFEDNAPPGPIEDYHAAMFDPESNLGVDDYTVQEYFDVVSDGRFSIGPGPEGLAGWYQVSQRSGDYHLGDAVNEAIDLAIDDGFDVTAYDQENDTQIVALPYTGGGGGGVAWVGNTLERQGIRINGFCKAPARASAAEQDVNYTCHEYLHLHGLTDLYQAPGTGNMGIMGAGPLVNMIPWSKVNVELAQTPEPTGWDETTPIHPTEQAGILPPQSVENQFYTVVGGPNGAVDDPDFHEHYYLAYNDGTGVDGATDPSQHGLVVWHHYQSMGVEWGARNLQFDTPPADGSTYRATTSGLDASLVDTDVVLDGVSTDYGTLQFNDPPHRSVAAGSTSVYAVDVPEGRPEWLPDLSRREDQRHGDVIYTDDRVDARVSWADAGEDVTLRLVDPSGADHAVSDDAEASFAVVRSDSRGEADGPFAGGWKLLEETAGSGTVDYYRTANYPTHELATTASVDGASLEGDELIVQVSLAHGSGDPYDYGEFGSPTADQFELSLDGSPVDAGAVSVSENDPATYVLTATVGRQSDGDHEVSVRFRDRKAGVTHRTTAGTGTVRKRGTPCEPTSITPYVRVDGGAWRETDAVTVQPGSQVRFGPQAASDGSWSWSGPGVSASTRELTVSPSETATYAVTYTNGCGETTTVEFTVTVAAADATPGPVGGSDALPGDPDADGVYEDVNGNERQDIADAVDLFQHRGDVDPQFFDFNDSGEMEIGDAVELFRENTG